MSAACFKSEEERECISSYELGGNDQKHSRSLLKAGYYSLILQKSDEPGPVIICIFISEEPEAPGGTTAKAVKPDGLKARILTLAGGLLCCTLATQ